MADFRIGGSNRHPLAPVTSPARLFGAWKHNQSGSVALIAAIAFPVLIGGMGLGAEVGYWYLTERKLQHAADVSAFGAAVRLSKGDADVVLDEVALNIAQQSGFNDAKGNIEVHHPPVSGPNAGDPTMVEVVLTEDIDRAFSGFFGAGDVLVHGRAVARISSAPNPACLIALAGSGSQTLSATGNGAITLNSCIAVANSTNSQALYVKGSGSLTAKCAYSASGSGYAQKANSLVTQCDPEVQQATVADPYKEVTPPTKSPTCYAKSGNQPAIPANPTRTVNGQKIWDLCALSVKGTVQLTAGGLYILYGGNLSSNGQGKLIGDGVTIYLTSKPSAPTVYSRITTTTTDFDLKAPTAGPYAGLVLWGDSANANTQNFGGNASLVAQGALRFPGGTVNFGGTSASGGCVQIVANKITFTGNGGISFGHQCAGTGTKTANAGATATVKVFE